MSVDILSINIDIIISISITTGAVTRVESFWHACSMKDRAQFESSSPVQRSCLTCQACAF